MNGESFARPRSERHHRENMSPEAFTTTATPVKRVGFTDDAPLLLLLLLWLLFQHPQNMNLLKYLQSFLKILY